LLRIAQKSGTTRSWSSSPAGTEPRADKD
jgi:hypothetical protein